MGIYCVTLLSVFNTQYFELEPFLFHKNLHRPVALIKASIHFVFHLQLLSGGQRNAL